MFFIHLQLKLLTNNKIKNEICFALTTLKALELKKIKNIVIAEIPTIEDVIVEVIGYNKRVSTHQLKFKYMIKNIF
jgi:uroporphyrinogen-III synthase